jgi:hypothetical protein
MAKLFAQLRDSLQNSGYEARSQKARAWFREQVRALNGRISRKALLNDPELARVQTPKWGYMYMFVYDPKHKDTLPYYDRFPLILLVEPDGAGTGFYGLNLHYIRPETRALFLDKLFDTVGSTGEVEDKTRLRIRYELISKAKRFREFRPCFKHYLFAHVKSRISRVKPTDWEIAIFLPTEHFAKANKTKVWKESLNIYRSA